MRRVALMGSVLALLALGWAASAGAAEKSESRSM